MLGRIIIVFMATLIMLASAGMTGCSRLRPQLVHIASTDKLDKNIRRDLLELASVQDVLDDDIVDGELMRLVLRDDAQNMMTYLRAQGHFDASVSPAITNAGQRTKAIFTVTPGPLYLMHGLDMNWPPDFEGPRPAQRDSPNPEPASFRNITTASRRAPEFLRETGYPDATVARDRITVDHATHTVHPEFTVTPGPQARFGGLDISGLNRLRPSYVEKSVPWAKGDIYQAGQLREFEQRLAASGLFSGIILQRDDATETPEVYDVKLTLRERRTRTIQLGVGYRTDTGGETSAQWQHRNLAGGGENLILRGKVSEDGFEAEARLMVPLFLRADQEWGNSFKISEESTDAYDSLSYEAETWLSRRLNTSLSLRTGAALHYLDETQADKQSYYFLASLPASLTWDRANDRLDATRGHRIYLFTEPYQSVKDSKIFFWKNLFSANGFLPLRRDQTVSVAVRLTGGSITGDSISDIPAESRFYAGGGQSVRGYAYQSLSPHEDGVIMGGRALVESSFEIRYRMNRQLGFVAFIDGGAAYADKIPEFDETYRWGVGGGFRYFTPVGPLRIDVAAPLNRRDGIDDSWQFYISLGQAF